MKYGSVTAVLLTLLCFSVHAQEAQEQGKRFDLSFGVGIGNRHEIGVLGYPFTDDGAVYPEFSVTHVPTGLFVSLLATKSPSDGQSQRPQQVGDYVLSSFGWAKEMKRVYIQTDFSLYDVEVPGERKRVGSMRLFVGSTRKRFSPYLWLQNYGGVDAYKVGLDFNRLVSLEVGGNSGISIFGREPLAFSRLKVRTPEIRWLGKGVATVTFQHAYELPFEDHAWIDFYWKII